MSDTFIFHENKNLRIRDLIDLKNCRRDEKGRYIIAEMRDDGEITGRYDYECCLSLRLDKNETDWYFVLKIDGIQIYDYEPDLLDIGWMSKNELHRKFREILEDVGWEWTYFSQVNEIKNGNNLF